MKKGILKTVICLALSFVMLLGVVACGSGDKGGDSDLTISIVKKGYGDEWLKNMAAAFEAETGISVDVKSKVGNAGQTALDNELKALKGDTDLFFTMRGWFAEDVYKGRISSKGQTYDCLYADLTDVWNSVVDEGSNLTIKDKMSQTYVDALNIEGKYYNLPWAGGVFGLVRNVNVWNELGLNDADVPYTTNELLALCDRVKDEIAPFIYCLSDEYYIAWTPLFFGQYEGVQNVKNFMEGKDPDGNYSEYLYTYKGLTRAMEFLETLVDDANGYQHPFSTQGIDFTTMQGHFLNGQALFSINGSWLENEMANFSSSNVDMLKTPVLSSIVEKLSFKSSDAKADDAKLIEVIKYVDAVDAGETPAKPAGVTDDDIKKVTEARHYSYVASGIDHRAYIPAYSDNIQTAKKFLKFMYSDKGLNIYYNSLKGAMLPATPTNGYVADAGLTLSNFRLSVNKAQEEGFVYDREPKSRYLVLGRVSACFENGGDPFAWLREGKTAEQVIARNNTELKDKWSDIRDLLGLD